MRKILAGRSLLDVVSSIEKDFLEFADDGSTTSAERCFVMRPAASFNPTDISISARYIHFDAFLTIR